MKTLRLSKPILTKEEVKRLISYLEKDLKGYIEKANRKNFTKKNFGL